MRENRKRARIFVVGAIVSVLCGATFASGATATPIWKLNGHTLEEPEATLSHAVESSLAIPGVTTTCEPFVYKMTIFGSAGSITKMPLRNCFTNKPACTVSSIEAEKLPWAAKLVTVGASNYLVIEGFKLTIVFGGEECVLFETAVAITGSAGGLIDNASESVAFSPSSFSATGTSLKALGQPSTWNGTFTMLTTGLHIGESLTVS
jgi:hypothetical protein